MSALRILILIVNILLWLSGWLTAQTLRLSLEETVALSKNQSLASRQAETLKKTNYWQYRSFLADYKPQLSLNGTLPGFTRSYVEVTQPDGSIAFQSVSNNNSQVNLALTQSIALTGGTVYLQKQLQRFDNFVQHNTVYNGIPFAVGIQQPLFRYNPMKWERRISPLLYQEGDRRYYQDMEAIALNATDFYFELLIAQVNWKMAEANLAGNEKLWQVAEEKLLLGKISENDFLQLQMAVLSSKKALAASSQTVESATLRLKMFLGIREDEAVELDIPVIGNPYEVDKQLAVEQAYLNRSEAMAFQRQLLESDRDVNKAKKENGLNAALNATFGLSSQGRYPGDVYRNPQDREFVEIQFALPIMTWGRNKARTAEALANQEFVQQSVAQGKLNFEQEIVTQVILLKMLQQQVKLTQSADELAGRRYQIAQDRFVLNNLSVTDLNIALQEKDTAKRDFILALRDYWKAHYNLRKLTLYDFENQKEIVEKERI